MKDVIWILVSAVFFIVSIILFFLYRARTKQIAFITEEIDRRLKGETHEKLLNTTDDPAVQKLFVGINRMLERQEELKNRQRKQEESDKRMLANISHDLKTPLTVMMGYSEMLQRSEAITDPGVFRKIEKIHYKTKDVLRMVEEFFDLAKIESGELQLNKENINLSEICRMELIQYHEWLEDTGFQVQIDIPPEDIWIEGDASAFRRILSNLLQNAVRYGADGSYLRMSIKETEQSILVEVEDRGKGILEENQSKIFERLATLEDSRNKKYQGSGLGLTITKRLTEAMGGTIQVRSKPYVRTVFTVSLPKRCKNGK